MGCDLVLMADKLLDRTGSILDAFVLVAAIGEIESLAAFLIKGGGEDPYQYQFI